MKKLIATLALTTACLAGTASAIPTATGDLYQVVDSFDGTLDPDNPLVQVAYAPAVSVLETDAVLGGWRKIEAQKSGLFNLYAAVVNGVYAHSSDTLTTGWSQVTWNADGEGLRFDLSQGNAGEGFFEVDVASVDLPTAFTITINGVDKTINNVSAGLLKVPLDDFIGVDPAFIDSMALKIAGDPGADITINEVGLRYVAASGSAPVSEFQLSGSVLALGLVGIAGARRRRHRG